MASEPDQRTLGETGLREALGRLTERVRNRSKGDPVISLGEALEWCYRLEEYHAKRLGRRAYSALRAGSNDGRALAGLMYARGLFTHLLVPAAALVTLPGSRRPPLYRGRRRTMAIIQPSTEYRFKPLSSLPAPGKPEKHGRDALYRLHLENKPIDIPMKEALHFLTQIK